MTDYIIDRVERRYVPCWKQQGRVQVDLGQLQRWYRTLDHLLLNKESLEVALYRRLRDLFDFRADLVLYHLTSTYSEGHGPGMAQHGYSREVTPRKVQLEVGVVMAAGWPIAHHIWSGTTRDSSTVQHIIDDLTKRFGFRRVAFAGDRGGECPEAHRVGSTEKAGTNRRGGSARADSEPWISLLRLEIDGSAVTSKHSSPCSVRTCVRSC